MMYGFMPRSSLDNPPKMWDFLKIRGEEIGAKSECPPIKYKRISKKERKEKAAKKTRKFARGGGKNKSLFKSRPPTNHGIPPAGAMQVVSETKESRTWIVITS